MQISLSWMSKWSLRATSGTFKLKSQQDHLRHLPALQYNMLTLCHPQTPCSDSGGFLLLSSPSAAFCGSSDRTALLPRGCPAPLQERCPQAMLELYPLPPSPQSIFTATADTGTAPQPSTSRSSAARGLSPRGGWAVRSHQAGSPCGETTSLLLLHPASAFC